MTSATMKYAAMTVAFAGALGITPTSSSLERIQSLAESRGLVAQFCLPPPADGSDGHRFYCLQGPG
jgi:hypothetical protein